MNESGYNLQGVALGLAASSDIPVEDPELCGHDSCSGQLEKYDLVVGRWRPFSGGMKPQLVHHLQHRKSLSVFLSFVSCQCRCLNKESKRDGQARLPRKRPAARHGNYAISSLKLFSLGLNGVMDRGCVGENTYLQADEWGASCGRHRRGSSWIGSVGTEKNLAGADGEGSRTWRIGGRPRRTYLEAVFSPDTAAALLRFSFHLQHGRTCTWV